MAITNHERVDKALKLLNQGLAPYVEREMKAIYGDKWLEEANAALGEDRVAPKKKGKAISFDTQALLVLIWNKWNDVFSQTLGYTERSIVSELREIRNKWAHQEAFSTHDAARALDSIYMLLSAISAEEAAEVDRQLMDLNRLRFEEQARYTQKKAAVAATDGAPASGLKPWRMVMTPHPDVAEGKYMQAEFAADLAQVHRGEAASEYGDPVEFFRRTFLTEGLKTLLAEALKRMSKSGGAPVLKLQTNFGGGKTHSILALYHMFSGIEATKLPGIESILKEAKVSKIPEVRRAVLVGTALSPAVVRVKNDGTEIRTVWGELAWQLLGKKGYKLVADSDKSGVSPGSDVLVNVFKQAAPCIILIDEWVAYIRLLYNKEDLPGGNFDSNFTFAQSLTEAVDAVPGVLLVASLPMSDIEKGGEGGREALGKLENVFDRYASPWRPASAEEGFEIVRRRMFEPITDPELQRAKDAVVREFSQMYQQQSGEFPSECREADYKRRMDAAYPIHPELFDRLFKDWSGLERFQRTRGVLRLMAEVIQTLWERNDPNLLIMPAMVPIDEHDVQAELTRYLDPVWSPVIEKDIDGPHSLPLQLDRENPNLGRYSACRRVARTIYLGSAPTLGRPNKGLEDKQIKLGCAQPGETVATFGDALRRLSDRANYLYVDGRRYWFAPQPTVTRLALDRAGQFDEDTVMEEIRKYVKLAASHRGEFSRVHVCPASCGEVPDEHETRLVVLGPEYPHIPKDNSSPARVEVMKILDSRGSTPRQYRNMLVFLVADKKRLEELVQAVRALLAWKSIENEKDGLNLDAFQTNQARSKREEADKTVKSRIPETYSILLVPEQDKEKTEVEWKETRLQGDDHLADRASKKLKNEELLISEFAGTRLRLELDKIPLWDGNHISIKQLVDYFAKYLYLPRLKDVTNVLLESVRDGLNPMLPLDEVFAYADSYDQQKDRYIGLRSGRQGSVTISGLLVKPDIARKQLEAEKKTTEDGKGPVPQPVAGGGKPTLEGEEPKSKKELVRPVSKRFHATATLEPTRLARDAGEVAREVIQHLTSLANAKVEVTLEIQAKVPDGVPDNVVRTVTENCRTLKFDSYEFEEE
jgi:hypothetical protein